MSDMGWAEKIKGCISFQRKEQRKRREEGREEGREGACGETHLSWSFWSFFLKRRGLLLLRPPEPPPRCLAEV